MAKRPPRKVAKSLQRPRTQLGEWMASHNRTIYQLAKGAGIAWPTAWRYVSGQQSRPSKEVAERISAWTGGALSASDVAGWEAA